MSGKAQELSLANIVKPGMADELFRYEVDRVMRNILDNNTSFKTKRKIKIEFEFSTDEDREAIDISMKASSTIAPVKDQNGMAFLHKKGNSVKAYANNIHQPPLIPDEDKLEVVSND